MQPGCRLPSRCWRVLPLRAATRPMPAAKPELVLRKGDRIILIGNTLAERMQYFGHFETLAARPLSRARAGRPQPGLFGRRADAAAAPGPLRRSRPHAQGREARRADRRLRLQRVVRRTGRARASSRKTSRASSRRRRPTKYNGKEAPRLVLLSPIAQEDLKNPHITDGKKNNDNIELYTDAMAELAAKHGVVFVDLFAPEQAALRGERRAAHDQRHPSERRGLQAAGARSSTRHSSARRPARPRPT